MGVSLPSGSVLLHNTVTRVVVALARASFVCALRVTATLLVAPGAMGFSPFCP